MKQVGCVPAWYCIVQSTVFMFISLRLVFVWMFVFHIIVMWYFLVKAFKWVFDMGSKIITFKGFKFNVTKVFGHHVAFIYITVCLSCETVLSYSHTMRQAWDGLFWLWVQAGAVSDFEPWLMTWPAAAVMEWWLALEKWNFWKKASPLSLFPTNPTNCPKSDPLRNSCGLPCTTY